MCSVFRRLHFQVFDWGLKIWIIPYISDTVFAVELMDYKGVHLKKVGNLPFQNGVFSQVSRGKSCWTVHCVPQVVSLDILHNQNEYSLLQHITEDICWDLCLVPIGIGVYFWGQFVCLTFF